MKFPMHAARQLPERGPTDVEVASDLHVNQNSDDDDDEFQDKIGNSCLSDIILA